MYSFGQSSKSYLELIFRIQEWDSCLSDTDQCVYLNPKITSQSWQWLTGDASGSEVTWQVLCVKGMRWVWGFQGKHLKPMVRQKYFMKKRLYKVRFRENIFRFLNGNHYCKVDVSYRNRSWEPRQSLSAVFPRDPDAQDSREGNKTSCKLRVFKCGFQ